MAIHNIEETKSDRTYKNNLLISVEKTQIVYLAVLLLKHGLLNWVILCVYFFGLQEK